MTGIWLCWTFLPIIWMETIQAILVLVPIKHLKIQQMDVKGTYLNGQLKETVYMRQPKGYEDTTGWVCKLVKTLYGLKQLSWEWNKEFNKKLTNFRFQCLHSDPCTFTKQDGDHSAIITVWVDDILLFTTSDELMSQTKSDLHTKWEMTDLGEPTKIISVEITQTENSMTISQKVYIESILECKGLSEINSIATPLDLNVKLKLNPDGNERSWSNSFARLLRELQYLANCKRPNILFAVNQLAAYTANPSIQHVMMLKWILQYSAGTKNLSITYSKTSKNPNNNSNITHGFADAAFVNHNDHKSTSGYVFLAAGGAITLKSKKQTTIALSSTEVEYVALSEARHKACWLWNLFEELGYPQEYPTLIKGDNNRGSQSERFSDDSANSSETVQRSWFLIWTVGTRWTIAEPELSWSASGGASPLVQVSVLCPLFHNSPIN